MTEERERFFAFDPEWKAEAVTTSAEWFNFYNSNGGQVMCILGYALAFMAAYEDTEELKQGQLKTSLRALAKECKSTATSIRRNLKILEDVGAITWDRKTGIITVHDLEEDFNVPR